MGHPFAAAQFVDAIPGASTLLGAAPLISESRLRTDNSTEKKIEYKNFPRENKKKPGGNKCSTAIS